MTVPPVMPVGSEWSISPIGDINTPDPQLAVGGTGASGGFGGALTNAIDALQQTQDTAATAAQGLATGTVTDPQQAIVDVENAQLAMQLASQVRDKAVETTQSLFQMQV